MKERLVATIFKRRAVIFLLGFVLFSLQFFSLNTFLSNPVYAQVGGQCRFDQASCTWDAQSDATSFNVTVTEIDTGQVVKQETVGVGTTKIVFPVTANMTYRCDVSAVNACGTAGPAGSAEALCAAEGAATPAPTVAPTIAPTPAPTVAPRIQVACGSSCTTNADCQTGLTCLKIGNDAYCARPEYQAACIQNPTLASCCQAPRPTPQPTLPPSGLVEDTMMILMIGLVIFVLGFGGILLTTRKRS